MNTKGNKHNDRSQNNFDFISKINKNVVIFQKTKYIEKKRKEKYIYSRKQIENISRS